MGRSYSVGLLLALHVHYMLITFSSVIRVVCPVSLVSQWASEIAKMAKNMIVVEHHGPSRTTSMSRTLHSLSTTDSSLDPETLKRAHVVVTSYAITASEYAAFQPKDESKPKKGSDSKRVSGSGSDSEADHFGRTLESKKKAATGRKRDALFRIKWWRIVLDEAHNIKNRNTKSAQACCTLEGKYRWCLTGTPL
jgi:SNF2 family DNA or RNA helicase